MADPTAPDGRPRPLTCVVIEGYNESKEQGVADDTMAALAGQDYPLDRVHVVLVGSDDQVREWREKFARGSPFASVVFVEAEGASYYELKNRGARAVPEAEVIAFTDSDVRPARRWLSSIVGAIEAGADVSAGLSRFRDRAGRGPDDPLLLAAAAVTYGWVVGRPGPDGRPRAQGFLAHNVGFRAGVFHDHPYRTDLGRTCSSDLLFHDLIAGGRRIDLQPEQRAAHYFAWGWWLRTFHYRVGYEVYTQRRESVHDPSRWVARTSVFEPVVTMAWHFLADQPRWFRHARLLGVGPIRRVALFPAVVALSAVARGAEMVGMYSTLLAPRAMRRWAEKS
jgi:glycosyltransferase involved in cell wall biosynthesis